MGQYAEYLIEDEIFGEVEKPIKNKSLKIKEHNKKGYVGVYNWLKNNWLFGLGHNTQHETNYDRLIKRYGKEILKMEQSPKNIANHISKHCWVEFVKWVKENYK